MDQSRKAREQKTESGFKQTVLLLHPARMQRHEAISNRFTTKLADDAFTQRKEYSTKRHERAAQHAAARKWATEENLQKANQAASSTPWHQA